MFPAICFVFSKKKHEYTKKITVPLFDSESKIPIIVEKECKKILINKLLITKYIQLNEF